MKRVAISFISVSIILCILVASCYRTTNSSSDTYGTNTTANTSIVEQYFEGNLCYSPNATFFEESISGAIIPVDMTGLSFMVDTEYPELNSKKGEPIHVKLSGHLAPQSNNNDTTEIYLTIKEIKGINEKRHYIQPMTGIYNGDGHTLTISPDHTYTYQEKNGNFKEGNWFLRSKNIMILLSEESRTVMKINYKKKSLNTRDDHPTIFMLSTTLSNH